METSGATSLVRSRPAIVALISVAAVTTVYLIANSIHRPAEHTSHTSELHRSNAIRRPNRTRWVHTEDGAHDQDDGDTIEFAAQNTTMSAEVDDATTEISLDDEATAAAEAARSEDGQKLRELMFAISKNRAKNEGIIHRGVTCDNCNRVPIQGVRYHCSNCPDFDLCEDCEAQDVHLKTHVFYKVKVPAPWGGKQPLPLWYPGRPYEVPDELPQALKRRLSEEIGCSGNKIDGLYVQWANLANVKWPEDPNNLCMAIDRAAFDRCFVPQTSDQLYPEPNLIHDQLYKFYTRKNPDKVIGFEDFAKSTTMVQDRDREKRKKRIFEGLDLDQDGFVCRKDMLMLFRSYYELNRSIMMDYLKADREGENAVHVVDGYSARDIIASSRPLASYFGHGQPEFRWNPSSRFMKVTNVHGDLVPVDNHIRVVETRRDLRENLNREAIAKGSWVRNMAVLDQDMRRVVQNLPARWLNGDQVQIVIETSGTAARRWEIPPQIIDIEGEPWLAYRAFSNRTACLKILDSDFEIAFPEQEIDWKEQMADESFCNRVFPVVRNRVSREAVERFRMHNREKAKERRELEEFYLSDEDVDFSFSDADGERTKLGFDKEQSSSHANNASTAQDAAMTGLSASEINVEDQELIANGGEGGVSNGHLFGAEGEDNPQTEVDEDEPKDSNRKSTVGSGSLKSDSSFSEGHYDVRAPPGKPAEDAWKQDGFSRRRTASETTPILSFIGGTAAAQVIYDVTQQGLNDLVDPVFKPSEKLAIEVRKTVMERERYDVEIAEWDLTALTIEQAISDARDRIEQKDEDKLPDASAEDDATEQNTIDSIVATEDSRSSTRAHGTDADTIANEQRSGELSEALEVIYERWKTQGVPITENLDELRELVKNSLDIMDELNRLDLLHGRNSLSLSIVHENDKHDRSNVAHAAFLLTSHSLPSKKVWNVWLELEDPPQHNRSRETLNPDRSTTSFDSTAQQDETDMGITRESSLFIEQTSSERNQTLSSALVDISLPASASSSSAQRHVGIRVVGDEPSTTDGSGSADIGQGQRPSTDGTQSDGKLTANHLAYLSMLNREAEKIRHRGGGGRLDMAEFSERMEKVQSDGGKFVNWVGGWLDLVMF